MVYLLQVFNMSQVGAANVVSIWIGVSNCIPILGAAVADAYLGKFRTIVLASFATLVVCKLLSFVIKAHNYVITL